MEEEQLQVYNSDSAEDTIEVKPEAEVGWIPWFCALEGHEHLLQVEAEFIADGFNTHGLLRQYNVFFGRRLSKDRFRKCISMILSPISPNKEDLADEGFLELNQEASELYSLIHGRYVYTPKGMAKVFAKHLGAGYGYCPRTLCDKQKLLPMGISDIPRTARFKVFCPRCEEVYIPKIRNTSVDGACFGTSFPQAFLMNYPNVALLPPKIHFYEPQIFGFKLAGKRGSKSYKGATECNGTVRLVEETTKRVDNAKRDKIVQAIIAEQVRPRHSSPVKQPPP